MSPQSKKVTFSSSAAFPADLSRPSENSPPSYQNNPPNYRHPPVHYQSSPDYQDTTNQKSHYDSVHAPTISLKTGFRYNNPYANSNDHIVATKNTKQNFTQHTNDARHHHQTNSNRDPAQRQKLLDFIISDSQPQSFQSPPPTRTPLSANDIKFVNNAIVNINHDSSSIIISTPSSLINTTSIRTPQTTSHPDGVTDIGSLQLPAANDDSIRFILSTNFGPKISPNRTKIGSNPEASESKPSYTRNEVSVSSSTTTSTAAPRMREEIVVPTTYAPLKNWKLQYVKRPAAPVTTLPLNTIANSHSDDKKHSTPFDEITFSTPVGPVTSKFPTPDYSRPISPSVGTRQQSFREILNKTYETSTPSKYHVSPYTSLKSLLSDEPTKFSIRPTTALPSSSSPQPTSNPFRNYFLITAPPKKFTSDSTTYSPTHLRTNIDQTTTTTPISITSSASPLVSSSNYDWTPINYNYHGKVPPSLAPLKPTENSIDLDGVDMTTSFPIRPSFSSTYYPRPTLPSTTTPPSITTARILLASTSERDHYRKVVRMRSKKKLNPSNGQTSNDDAGEIIRGHPYGKLSEPIVITSEENKSPYHHSNRYSPIDVSPNVETSSEHVGLSSNLPTKFYSNYRHVKDEKTLADYIRDAGPDGSLFGDQRTQESISASTGGGSHGNGLHDGQRPKFRATVEMPEFNIPTESEIKAKLKQLEDTAEKDIETEERYETTTAISRHDIIAATTTPNDRTKDDDIDTRRMTGPPIGHGLAPQSTTRMYSNSTQTTTTQRTINPIHTIPPRASRVNAAIKTTIAAASLPPTRRSNTATTTPIRFATLPLLKCTDSTPNAKCNEIPSR